MIKIYHLSDISQDIYQIFFKNSLISTKGSGPTITMILVSPLRWHFCFFWILPLPSPSGICDQNHLELAELPAKSFCRGGELVAFSRTVQGRRNGNYSCTIVSPVGSFLFGSQFWKGERKPPFLRRQEVCLRCLLTPLSNLKSRVQAVDQSFPQSPRQWGSGLKIKSPARLLHQDWKVAPTPLHFPSAPRPNQSEWGARRVVRPSSPRDPSIEWVQGAVENRAQTQ